MTTGSVGVCGGMAASGQVALPATKTNKIVKFTCSTYLLPSLCAALTSKLQFNERPCWEYFAYFIDFNEAADIIGLFVARFSCWPPVLVFFWLFALLFKKLRNFCGETRFIYFCFYFFYKFCFFFCLVDSPKTCFPKMPWHGVND